MHLTSTDIDTTPGDVIAISKLVATITRELGESSNADHDYQWLVAELVAIRNALEVTEQSHQTRMHDPQVANIRRLIDSCMGRIHKFNRNLSGLEPYLGSSGATATKWRVFPRRVKWQLKYKEEAQELRATIGPLIAALNL